MTNGAGNEIATATAWLRKDKRPEMRLPRFARNDGGEIPPNLLFGKGRTPRLWIPAFAGMTTTGDGIATATAWLRNDR